jgi:WD40 repeat protein
VETIAQDPTAPPPPHFHLTVSQCIGDYEILEEIARGGMGVVFRARQVSLNRIVALKMILAGQLAGRDALERFRLEATAVAHLDHPNIVHVYEVGEEAGQHFFSMQLMEGGSLAQHLGKYLHDPAAASKMVEKIARAVHHAHQRGILHRDLKPANILLDTGGQPHVSDFGLAKWAESGTQFTKSISCMGTPSYMAPEQALGDKGISTAADVYSLGAILYQMLTGVPPFVAPSQVEILRQVVDNEPTAPRSLKPRVPRDLETICLKCLRKKPQLRYASAEALADDLRRFCNGEPIHARQVGTVERLWSWCRRKPALASAGAAAIFATVAALIILSVSVAVVSRARTSERRINAQLLLESGNGKLASGEAAQGLLSLACGLDKAAASGAADIEQSIRQQIGVWKQFVHSLRCVVDHGTEVSCIAASADGTTIVTGGGDQARVWNVASGQQLCPALRHGGTVRAVAMDPTGHRVLTGSDDGTAILWDAKSGRRIVEPMSHGAAVLSLDISPDGAWIATAGQDNAVRLWDATNGSLRKILRHDAAVLSLDFSPDSRTLLTGAANGTARVWNTASGQLEMKPVAPGERVRAVSFTSDGGIVSVTSRARIWDAQSRKASARDVEIPEGTNAVALCKQGLLLTGGYDSLARLWDVQGALPIGPPILHPGRVTAAAISGDGKWLVTGCVDGTARVWQVATGQAPQAPLRAEGPIQALAVRPGGAEVVSGDAAGTAIVWALDTGKRSATLKHDKPVMAVACASSGSTVVTGCQDGRAYLWNGLTGKLLGAPLLHGSDTWVDAVAVSPDSRRVLTGGNDFTARLWDLTSGQPIGAPMQHQEAITTAAFRPDGTTVLTASRDGSARLWDAQSGQAVGRTMRHEGTVWAALFSPTGGYIVTVSADKTARLWNDRTGEALGPPLGHEDEVLQAAFNPQGTIMATAGRNGSVCLWDMHAVPSAAPRLLHRIKLSGAVVTMAFSPGGGLLLTGSNDNIARLWDVSTADPVGPPMRQGQAVSAVAFGAGGKLALTASADGTLRLWPCAAAGGSAAELTTWAEVTTGMTQDGAATLRWLSAAEWWERYRRLEK